MVSPLSERQGFVERSVESAKSIAAMFRDGGDARGWQRVAATCGVVLMALLIMLIALPMMPFSVLVRRYYRKRIRSGGGERSLCGRQCPG